MTKEDLENLNDAQFKTFVEAIQKSYDDIQLGMLLRTELGRNLSDLAGPSIWPERVFGVVVESQKQGFGSQLLKAIEADRPDAARIQGLRARLAELQSSSDSAGARETQASSSSAPKSEAGSLRHTSKTGALGTSEKVVTVQRGIAVLEVDAARRPPIAFIQDSPVANDRPVEPAAPTRQHVSAGKAEPKGPTWGLEAVGALASPCRGEGCVVALLGTGIDSDHPAFAGIDIRQRDFSGSGNGDRNGHSTHVAGSLFGRDVDGQRIGVAPGVTRVLVAKTLDDSGIGKQSEILYAIQWVLAEGADVICIPMGFDFPQLVMRLLDVPSRHAAIAEAFLQYTQYVRLYETIARMAAATGKGVVIVTAAGNESTAQMRVPVTSPLSLAEGGISVGAVLPSGPPYRVAVFSNSRPTLSAPGAEIVSARAGGGLMAMSGTSMACGFAAGVAALWWEHLRNTVGDKATGPMVTAAMLSAADPKFAPGVPATDYGAGLVQAPR
ncbi:S8 family serine peptidase [Mesorhizobium sp. M0771]|uniref:S8 family serine peptidase n=1 Tax=Mesorhizobium sp. M0771 TaxID=2956997 RepID=UPI003337F5FA